MNLDSIVISDALSYLQGLPDDSVHCIITSTPYYGLRDYEEDGQIGLEPTVQEFTQNLQAIFNQARRVLKTSGTLWLNIGDSYASGGNGIGSPGRSKRISKKTAAAQNRPPRKAPPGFNDKTLLLIPSRVAIALQDSGWIVRAELPWIKINALPESAKNRPAKSHEYVFMTKAKRYYYDIEAIKKPLSPNSDVEYRNKLRKGKTYAAKAPYTQNFPANSDPDGRNYRSGDPFVDTLLDQAARFEEIARQVRAIAMGPDRSGAVIIDNEIVAFMTKTEPTKHKHSAAFPTALIEPMIPASCPPGGVVL